MINLQSTKINRKKTADLCLVTILINSITLNVTYRQVFWSPLAGTESLALSFISNAKHGNVSEVIKQTNKKFPPLMTLLFGLI